jgi:hypothetical protein
MAVKINIVTRMALKMLKGWRLSRRVASSHKLSVRGGSLIGIEAAVAVCSTIDQ